MKSRKRAQEQQQDQLEKYTLKQNRCDAMKDRLLLSFDSMMKKKKKKEKQITL